jgi:tRNA (guanine-N7-)-methyltransferase
VRRARRLPLEALAPYLLETAGGQGPGPEGPPRLDWRAVFGSDQPVEIEVGFGKGLFLVTTATAHPEVNYLGIEIARGYQLFAATRVARRDLKNVRLALGDARVFLRDRVPGATVQAVHVYFPDPWWKQRHRKRRVFTPEFAAGCERVLRPGGSLQVATDVEEYFQVMRQTVAGHTRLRELPPPPEQQPAHDLDYLTNFERKFRKQGKPVYRASFAKAEATPPAGAGPEEGVAPDGRPGPVLPAG